MSACDCLDAWSSTATVADRIIAVQSLLACWPGDEDLTADMIERTLTLHLTAACSKSSDATDSQSAAWQSLNAQLHARLLQLPANETSFEAISAVIAAHTSKSGAESASSRRNSLQPHAQLMPSFASASSSSSSLGASASRRNSLSAQPLAEQSVASVRLASFRFALDFARSHAGASEEVEQFWSRIVLQGLSDYWSAIRRLVAGELKDPQGIVARLVASSEKLLEFRMALLDLSFPKQVGVSPAWQSVEGSLLGLGSFLSALVPHAHSNPEVVKSFTIQFGEADIFYPFLAHAQQSVREYAVQAVKAFLSLIAACTSEQQGREAVEQVQGTLLFKLRDALKDSQKWADAYELEGILSLLSSLSPLRYAGEMTPVLDTLLSHPASSVRQAAAALLASLGLDRRFTGEEGFDLLELLSTPPWEWEAQEEQARVEAKASGILGGEAHVPGVFFSIPPPLAVAVQGLTSRRASLSGAELANVASSASPAAAAASSAPSPSSSPRASWQWKEGALMTLEIFLRALAAQPDRAWSPSWNPSLSSLFAQTVRASLSWSWELRRMGEQVRPTFLAVWMHSTGAGAALVQLCRAWLQLDSTAATSAPMRSTGTIPLLASSSAVLALNSVLGHLQKSAAVASAPALPLEKSDNGVERRWNQELEQQRSVPQQVWSDLAKAMPSFLDCIEKLTMAAVLAEQPSLGSAPLDVLSANESTSLILCSDEFSTLALQCFVSAYAVLGERSGALPSSAAPIARMHVASQCQLLHYQCVLDRLRNVRAICVGEPLQPAPSSAAQMIPPSPQHALSALVSLPGFASLQTPIVPPALPSHSKLQRARAKRLEVWLLPHLHSTLPGFAANTPAAAQVDLMDLLTDYLQRYHTAAVDIRATLLRSIGAAWSSQASYSRSRVWSHQMRDVHERSINTLIELLPEHAADRPLVCLALSSIVSHAPLTPSELQTILAAVAGLVRDEYLGVSLSSPPPATPSVLSPTSAAAAAVAEADSWDAWDEDDDSPATPAAAAAAMSPSECFQHASQLVGDVAPLLRALHGQTHTAEAHQQVASSPSTVPVSSSSVPPAAHAQSSLSELIANYDHEASSAQPSTDRQLQLLKWMQQWAQQMQGEVAREAAAPSAPASSLSSASVFPRFSSQRSMPINEPLDEAVKRIHAHAQAKLKWLHAQAKAQG